MALHMTGECLGISRVMRGNPGETFEVVNIHLLDRSAEGVHTHEVPLVRNFVGALPEPGEFVVLDVFIAKWRSKAGNAGYDLKALSRNAELERSLSRVPA